MNLFTYYVIQSSTGMAATWDTELIKTVGLKLLAEEAKLRAASVILAPTCNIQRVSALLFQMPLRFVYLAVIEPTWRKSTFV